MVVAGEVFLVDCTFCQYWRRCPFDVDILLGKCFRTRAELIPGRVVKKPAVIVGVRVDTTVLKAAWLRYCIMSDLVERMWNFFENGEC